LSLQCFDSDRWMRAVNAKQYLLSIVQSSRWGLSANQSIATTVVAVTARDHVPRQCNVIGLNKFAP